MLDLDIDPKLAWALRHRERFPVDLNRAERAMLLRVPGLGKRTVERIIAMRRVRAVRLDDLQRLRVPLRRCGHSSSRRGRAAPPRAWMRRICGRG